MKRLQFYFKPSNLYNFGIFTTIEFAPMPAFVEGIHVPKAALPEAVAPGLDARVVNAGKVAEQAFTSDGSHP